MTFVYLPFKVNSLRDIVIILKTFVCIERVVMFVLDKVKDSVEQLSRNFFYKIHVRKLQLENLR